MPPLHTKQSLTNKKTFSPYQLRDSRNTPTLSTHYHTPPYRKQGCHRLKNWQDQTYHPTYSPNSDCPSTSNQEDTFHPIKRNKHKSPSASTTGQKNACLQHLFQYLYLTITGYTTLRHLKTVLYLHLILGGDVELNRGPFEIPTSQIILEPNIEPDFCIPHIPPIPQPRFDFQEHYISPNGRQNIRDCCFNLIYTCPPPVAP